MLDNSKIRTLSDLINYGSTSDYTFPKCITLRKFNKVIIPDDVVYDKYRDIINSNLETMELTIEEQKNYIYHPDRFCMDIYGNPNLSHLILYINNCSESEFKPEKIKYLSINAIGDVLKVILTHESSKISDAKKKVMG